MLLPSTFLQTHQHTHQQPMQRLFLNSTPSSLHAPNRLASLILRASSSAPPPSTTPPSTSPSVQPPIVPTIVPRKPGVTDGPWDAQDRIAVEEALADARALANKKHAAKHGPVLLCASDNELHTLLNKAMAPLTSTPVPAYRAKQLRDAVLHGVRDVDAIANVPKNMRAALKTLGVRTGRSKVHHSVTAADGTRKFLLQLHDGYVVETVGIPETTSGRLTVCVSSQVGCPMRCTFCATGKGGYARNLAPHEIVDQVLTVQEQFGGTRVSNVVFMGQGEPLLNLPSVVSAVQSINKDLGIGARHITISTVGVPNAIVKLAAYKLQCTLAVSIHAPNQHVRRSIVPSAKAYPLSELMKDCAEYFRITGRRVTFEYTLLAGVNDGPKHATELAALLKDFDLRGHCNLIPWNPVGDSDFERPSRNAVMRFQRALEEAGIPVSVRITRGLEAAAACGQLRNEFQKTPLSEFEALA